VSVHVEVYAERNPKSPVIVKVTEADLTYVAIDKEGMPRQIPRDEDGQPLGALRASQSD
jgi:acyl-CoA thioesterase YciA